MTLALQLPRSALPTVYKTHLDDREHRELFERIDVFKNVFLGGVMREKGFENRNRSLIWSVLARNVWVLARKRLADEAERLQDAA